MTRWSRLVLSALLLAPMISNAQTLPALPSSPDHVLDTKPWNFGVITQDGFGLTENRNSFKFISGGVHLGKVLTGPIGPGPLRGTFEYAVELYPFWQSYTPTFYRANCVAIP